MPTSPMPGRDSREETLNRYAFYFFMTLVGVSLAFAMIYLLML